MTPQEMEERILILEAQIAKNQQSESTEPNAYTKHVRYMKLQESRFDDTKEEWYRGIGSGLTSLIRGTFRIKAIRQITDDQQLEIATFVDEIMKIIKQHSKPREEPLKQWEREQKVDELNKAMERQY